MAEVTRLTLAVDSTQVRTATTALDRFGKQGQQTERQVRSLGQTFRGVQAAAGALAGSLVAREVIRAADAYTNLSARLQLVSRSTQEFARAQSEVLRIAQQTRVGLTQTADLYGSLARSTEELGVSQDDLLRVTESINKALIISGASAAGAEAALVQLGQGFAAGALRGEELNSVLEQAPRLARAIADGLGVPIGRLRELGAAGELTAERVFAALQSSAQRLDEEFARLPTTVGQATTQAANAFTVLIGAVDQSTGATGGLAAAITNVSELALQLAEDIRRANQGADDVGLLARAFTIVSQTVRILLADVRFVFTGIGREIGAVAAQLAALGRLDFKGFRAISDAVREDAARARAELDRYQREVLNPALSASAALSGLPNANNESEAERRRLGLSSAPIKPNALPLPPLPSPTPKPQTPQLTEAQRYLQTLQQQLEATEKLSVTEALLRDIQLGRLGQVTAAQQQELVSIAQQIDEVARRQQAERDRAEAEKQAIDERNALLQEGASITDSVRTAAEVYADRIERLNFLLSQGVIQQEAYTRAAAEARDEYVAGTQTIDELAQKQKTLGDELGLTFASAFEDAIVKGERFSDVLKGLAQDILRITTRKLVTEPLGNIFTDILGGINFGSIFGRAIGGPVSRGGLYEVNERGPELLNLGGRQLLMMGNSQGTVQPNSQVGGGGQMVNITVNVPIGAPKDRATALQFGRDISRQLSLAQSRNG